MRYLATLAICFFCLGFGTARAQSPCQPDQVTASDRVGIAAGNLYIDIRIKNTAQAPCLLAGAPHLTLMNDDGSLVVPIIHWPVATGSVQKGDRSIIIAPGQQALFVIHTLNRTGFTADRPCTQKIGVSLPGGVQAIDVVKAESCDAIDVSAYQSVN